MASSVGAPVGMSQATKRTHAEMSSSELSSQQNPGVQSSLIVETQNNGNPSQRSQIVEPTGPSLSKEPDNFLNCHNTDPSKNSYIDENSKDNDVVKQLQEPSTEIYPSAKKATGSSVEPKIISNGSGSEKTSMGGTSASKEAKKIAAEHIPISSALAPSSQMSTELRIAVASGSAKSTPEPMETSVATASQDTTAKPSMETAASQSKSATSKGDKSTKLSNTKPQLEDGEEPEKKVKGVLASSTNKDDGKSPEQVLELMDRTFEQRRKVVTKQMPTIPELKKLYPDLFTGKQLLLEFQRITKIDIDQKIQEFCVRYATAVIELARNEKGAAPVLARWEQAKQENDTLRQYWDMVTALCLLPLHFGENFVEMVLEIGEDEEVVPQGKIVPTLVARGNIFRTDEFFLIAENTIVQEFEEFTIAFASLYSSYWVFNMIYPETIENTYNYIQRCIVRQREPGAIPLECKNFTKTLLKWNKGKEGK